jgi:hypothetical protein
VDKRIETIPKQSVHLRKQEAGLGSEQVTATVVVRL